MDITLRGHGGRSPSPLPLHSPFLDLAIWHLGIRVKIPVARIRVLAISMIHLLGRRLFKREVELTSAHILAISPFNVEYSQELRMYSLLLFLALLSMYYLVRFLERGSLAVSVSTTFFPPLSCSILTYSDCLCSLPQNIFVAGLLLLSRQRRSRLKQWILIQAITVIIFAPWISV